MSALLRLATVVVALGTLGADIDGERIRNADSEPQNWLAHGRTYAEQRFSPLDSIHEGNVADLGLAWSADLDTDRGLEATPIAVDGVLYSTGSWSVVFAHDARTGKRLWTYDPEVPKSWGAYACCDVVNRGVAVWKGRVYVGTIDGRLVALDAATGRVLWDKLTIDPDKPYTITGAPRVVKGLILIGNGGAEFGVRGYVSAYDAETGNRIWRFYTVPGDPALPYESPALERAAATWHGDTYWKMGGGGTAWDSMAYDPELDLLYVGTGNGSPWNRDVRSPGGGDNLFLSSILALRPDTGEYVWHYQTVPGDTWDYTATQHMVLAELEIEGRARNVLVQAPKNGFLYVLDRATGELISAEPYVETTWASAIDRDTGRPVEAAGARYPESWKIVAPAPFGGHNWHPMSFSPHTGLVYLPAMRNRAFYENDPDFVFHPGRFNLGIEQEESGQPRDPLLFEAARKRFMRGHLSAWDPVAQREVWRVEHEGMWNGGVLSTAGNLVFQGTGDARLVAYAADRGQPLWEAPAGTGVIAPPISYSVDGEQHIAVLVGWGGAYGLAVREDPAAGVTRGRLLAFKLGASGRLPAAPEPLARTAELPPAPEDAALVDRGEALYNGHCLRCHGVGAASGVLPDLRRLTPDKHLAFEEIVRDGLFRGAGMVGFADVLSVEDVAAIHAYVIQTAYDERAAAEVPGWWRAVKRWVYGFSMWVVDLFV